MSHGFFTVLVNETTGISNVEEMSVYAYYNKEDPVTFCDVFLNILPVYELTGANLQKWFQISYEKVV